MLLDSVRGDGERVSVGEIIDALDARAFGLATLIFSLPSLVPMPPGVPTLVGVALFVVSLQMVLGRRELWLPGFLSKRSFPRQALVNALQRSTPTLKKVEKVAKPRILVLTGRAGTILIGAVVLIMAFVLILPLPPGGNFPPALACAILGMGLAERDGFIVLLGYAVSIASTIFVTVVTVGFIKFVPKIADWLGGFWPG
ncbi:MAG: exopolysaccharide biosynthesis protein [Hyphomonadaceae bacterium]